MQLGRRDTHYNCSGTFYYPSKTGNKVSAESKGGAGNMEAAGPRTMRGADVLKATELQVTEKGSSIHFLIPIPELPFNFIMKSLFPSAFLCDILLTALRYETQDVRSGLWVTPDQP